MIRLSEQVFDVQSGWGLICVSDQLLARISGLVFNSDLRLNLGLNLGLGLRLIQVVGRILGWVLDGQINE